MLKRKAYTELISWKNRKHDCLVIKGHRQVGKTYIIRQFARDNYENFVEFNLFKEKSLHSAFDGDLDVDTIILKLSRLRDDVEFIPGKTLIFFDEIQECPRARSSLKFFSEDGRFDVIGSGSLLGINIPGKKYGDAPSSMGYEELILMYSLDFEEFLWAMGVKQTTIDEIRSCISERRPIDSGLLDRIWSMYKDFMILGGMPAAVQEFVNGKSYKEAGTKLDSIINLAKTDMVHYSKRRTGERIVDCFNSIPAQLSETNKKFMYTRIVDSNDEENRQSRKSKEKYGNSLDWIIDAGYGIKCLKLETLSLPLRSEEVPDIYRIYLSDSGMLTRMYSDGTARAIFEDDLSYNMGALAESKVAECLVKSGFVPRYYSKNKGTGKMELDFVIELGTQLAVIEVKSGKDREYPSLNKVQDQFDVDRRIVLERDNIHVSEDGVEHYPLFTAAFIGSMEEPWDGPEF